VAQYATQLLLALDLLGVAVFALSGALVAIRSHLDVFRVLVLAYATALAGGVTRDVLIGAIPPQGTSDWRYPSLAYTPGAAAIVWHRGIERLRQPILVLDAAGLAVFAVSGTQKALAYNLTPVMAALLGVLTAVGGGLFRDLLLARVPTVLQVEIYAAAALAGSAVVVLGHMIGLRPLLMSSSTRDAGSLTTRSAAVANA
jgi:uncharacterized membrane protein YeiH